MTNYFENKLSMYQKVFGYMGSKTDRTNAIPAVATLQAALGTQITNIINYATVADADNTGHTVDKDNRRTELEERTIKVASAVLGYAVMNDNNSLEEKNDETVASQSAMRDNDIYIYSTAVRKGAENIIGTDDPESNDLTPFGLLATDMSTLITAQEAYLPFIQDPRLQINESSTAREDMVRTFQETDKDVIGKLDKIMRIFITTDPSLYNGYKGARNIDDDGHTMTTPDYTGTAAAGEIIQIAEIDYTASRQFKFNNDGEEALTFALSTTPDTVEGTPVTVEPGGSNQRLSSNLNEDMSANFLLVQNNGDNPSGYRIWITAE